MCRHCEQILGEYSKLWHKRASGSRLKSGVAPVNWDLISITRPQTQKTQLSQTVSFMQQTKLTNKSLESHLSIKIFNQSQGTDTTLGQYAVLSCTVSGSCHSQLRDLTSITSMQQCDSQHSDSELPHHVSRQVSPISSHCGYHSYKYEQVRKKGARHA